MSLEQGESIGNLPSRRYGKYFYLPKTFGKANPVDLLEIANSVDFSTSRKSNALAARDHLIVGSCLVEAAVILPEENDASIDERIELVDLATDHFKQSSHRQIDMLLNGYKEATDVDDWLRAELQGLFGNVYKDLICGELTLNTRQEICEALNIHLRECSAQKNHTHFDKSVFGLETELKVLIDMWENPIKEIAFPSTVRGGDGVCRANETHDIATAVMSPNGLRFDGIEVKGGRALKFRALGRYDRRIVHVSRQGKLRQVA